MAGNDSGHGSRPSKRIRAPSATDNFVDEQHSSRMSLHDVLSRSRVLRVLDATEGEAQVPIWDEALDQWRNFSESSVYSEDDLISILKVR